MIEDYSSKDLAVERGQVGNLEKKFRGEPCAKSQAKDKGTIERQKLKTGKKMIIERAKPQENLEGKTIQRRKSRGKLSMVR